MKLTNNHLKGNHKLVLLFWCGFDVVCTLDANEICPTISFKCKLHSQCQLNMYMMSYEVDAMFKEFQAFKTFTLGH
jgi:hypothetical protein